jgi:lysophospholipase L1-like esterase
MSLMRRFVPHFKPTVRMAIASLSTAILIMASLIPGVATAQGESPDDQTVSHIVWCGLWSGSNFDIPDDSSTCTDTNQATDDTSATTTNSPMIPGRYVALGDSVAAGLGLPAGSYTGTSDVQCGRSEQGYPNIVAASVHKQLINVSCSGATVGDLFTKQRVSGPNITAQLDSAFAGGTPGLMSITAGANDVHWSDFIQACYASDCSSGAYDAAADALRQAMRVKLNIALADIYARSHGNPPTVIVTGYYNPFSSACAAQQTQLSSTELAWFGNQNAMLNNTIQNVVATFSFVRYAPVSFSGHDLCSGSSWVQGPNDPAPFHPTATGQQAIAAAVLRATRQ